MADQLGDWDEAEATGGLAQGREGEGQCTCGINNDQMRQRTCVHFFQAAAICNTAHATCVLQSN